MKLKLVGSLLLICFGFNNCQNNTGPSKDPEENRFYSGYRNIYRSYGKVPLDSTKNQLNEYLHEFPESADGWGFLGSIQFLEKDYDASRLSYHKAIKLNRWKSSFYSSLGTTYSALGMIDSSKTYFMNALALQDSTAENYFNLALLYSKEGDTRNSQLYADSALLKKDIPISNLLGLSLVYSKNGNAPISKELIERTIQMGFTDTLEFSKVLKEEMKLEEFYRNNRF
ncbi:MAG: hypothetical protein IPP77_10095 [Bacteroidetes bacterium]|nr:hypothetical protein [Bacteroidota bacterium]